MACQRTAGRADGAAIRHTKTTPGPSSSGVVHATCSSQEAEGDSLGSSDEGAAGLGAGDDTFVVGFADPAGVLHAARAATIAKASNSRLNMESPPPLRQPTGCRRWSVWGLEPAAGAGTDTRQTVATPMPAGPRLALQSSHRCANAPVAAP